jgi:hypothetical protein
MLAQALLFTQQRKKPGGLTHRDIIPLAGEHMRPLPFAALYEAKIGRGRLKANDGSDHPPTGSKE